MRLSEVTKKSSETKADPSWSKTFLAPLPLPRQHSKNIQFATRPAEGWCMWPLRFWACTTISLLKNSAINWLGMMEALDTDTWQIQSWIWLLVKNTITMTTTVDCGLWLWIRWFGFRTNICTRYDTTYTRATSENGSCQWLGATGRNVFFIARTAVGWL